MSDEFLTRDSYIASPIPIEAELRARFPLESPLIIFDVGSCEAEDAIRYAQLFQSARVFAFEPLPGNVKIAKSLIGRYAMEDRIALFPLALSDAVGEATFYRSHGTAPHLPQNDDWEWGNKSSSLLPPERHLEITPWLQFEPVMVQIDTLEAFCRREGVEAIDFLHVDVQGAELKVLKGAGALLDRVRLIWMEVESIPLYAGQPLVGDVESFMAAHGFRKTKDTVGVVAGDQLYENLRDTTPRLSSRR